MLGDPCNKEDEDACVDIPDAECCDVAQCDNACMIPCDDETVCPEGMGCAHDHCLFECEAEDLNEPCPGLPGFTCQHGGPHYCEND